MEGTTSKDTETKADNVELAGKEKEAIKMRYLGAERKKKRIRRQGRTMCLHCTLYSIRETKVLQCLIDL